MNFWLTTHWPHRVGSNHDFHSGINLPDGREAAEREICPGDMALIFEAKTGRTKLKTLADGTFVKVPCQRGKQGIVTVAKVQTCVEANPGSHPESYVDGSKIWWRWGAKTHEEVATGFVPAFEVNRILGYKENYTFHAFGDRHSGVRRLTQNEYEQLLEMFKKSQPPVVVSSKPNRRGHRTPGGGEGPEHKALKSYVAKEPALALKEVGLRTLKVEYEFPSGDCADIVLVDGLNRPIGVEIEVEQDDAELVGMLQAIKYRYMLAVMHQRPFRESRAVLVAYKLGRKIKELCMKYEVQYVEIDREKIVKQP